MPLHEVGAPHERAVLAGASVVVPEIEIDEIDRLRERKTGERLVFAEAVNEGFRSGHLLICVLDDLFSLAVYTVDHGRSVALRADLLHLRLGCRVVGTLLGNRIREVVRKALRGIVRHTDAVDAAHVAGRTRRYEHVARGQGLGWGIEIQQMLLSLEEYAVLRFFVDFDLRVIGTHVTLGAGAGKARDADGTGVSRVTGRAIANRTVAVRFSYTVTLLAAASHRRAAFELNKGMRGTASSTGLVGFREIHLLWRESFLSVDGSPCWSRMATAKKLLVDRFVAAPAISRRKLGRDHKAVMIFFLLALPGLVTLETIDSFAGMRTHLIFMNHRILGALVALSTFPCGADELCAGLICFHLRTRSVQKKCGDD